MTTAAREELIRIFPQWFISAAEHHNYLPGQVMKFSPGRWFFPDFSFHYDEDDYVVMLFVDIDALVDELLAHKPGSFNITGPDLNLPEDWKDLNPQQIQDCLWYALAEWFKYFNYHVGVETGRLKSLRNDRIIDLRTACSFDTFSGRPNIQFRSEV